MVVNPEVNAFYSGALFALLGHCELRRGSSSITFPAAITSEAFGASRAPCHSAVARQGPQAPHAHVEKNQAYQPKRLWTSSERGTSISIRHASCGARRAPEAVLPKGAPGHKPYSSNESATCRRSVAPSRGPRAILSERGLRPHTGEMPRMDLDSSLRLGVFA
jgi:hypothetical protein